MVILPLSPFALCLSVFAFRLSPSPFGSVGLFTDKTTGPWTPNFKCWGLFGPLTSKVGASSAPNFKPWGLLRPLTSNVGDSFAPNFKSLAFCWGIVFFGFRVWSLGRR